MLKTALRVSCLNGVSDKKMRGAVCALLSNGEFHDGLIYEHLRRLNGLNRSSAGGDTLLTATCYGGSRRRWPHSSASVQIPTPDGLTVSRRCSCRKCCGSGAVLSVV